MSTNWEKFSKIIKQKYTSKSGGKPKKVTVLTKPEHLNIPDQRTIHAAKLPHQQLIETEDLKMAVTPLKDSQKKAGRYLAIDCEMVGVGPDAIESALARVSIVNLYGHVLLDKYVKTKERVTDFRTAISGIHAHHLNSDQAVEFHVVQKEVASLIKDRVLVGHAVHHDLQCLFLSHPSHLTRDTSKYKHFRLLAKGNTPSLRKLAEKLLQRDIQNGQHSSVEDARATMELYRLVKDEWEAKLSKKKAFKKPDAK